MILPPEHDKEIKGLKKLKGNPIEHKAIFRIQEATGATVQPNAPPVETEKEKEVQKEDTA